MGTEEQQDARAKGVGKERACQEGWQQREGAATWSQTAAAPEFQRLPQRVKGSAKSWWDKTHVPAALFSFSPLNHHLNS